MLDQQAECYISSGQTSDQTVNGKLLLEVTEVGPRMGNALEPFLSLGAQDSDSETGNKTGISMTSTYLFLIPPFVCFIWTSNFRYAFPVFRCLPNIIFDNQN